MIDMLLISVEVKPAQRVLERAFCITLDYQVMNPYEMMIAEMIKSMNNLRSDSLTL